MHKENGYMEQQRSQNFPYLVWLGVYTIKDLLDQNLDFLTYEEFKLRYQLQTIFSTYYGLI